MPIEFISSTNFGPSTGVTYPGCDPDCARRYVRMLDDGGFDWTLVGYDLQRVDSVTRAQFIRRIWTEDAQDYARHVLPPVRQELADREAKGTAPILNPDSAPRLAAHGQ